VIGAVTDLPMLRPLIGTDKSEIAAEAARLGTFDISVLPDQDCCQLFVPRHPATRARPAEVEAAEGRVDVPRLVALAVAGTERERYMYPAPTPRSVSSPRLGLGSGTAGESAAR